MVDAVHSQKIETAANPAYSFTHPVRVYYEDTDAGGIVYYANYIKFFERARTEWLRSLGIEQSAMASEHQLMFVVRQVTTTYHRSARLDDLLQVTARVQKLGRASIDVAQECSVTRPDSNGPLQHTLLAQGSIRIGCVDQISLRPTPMPDAIYHRLSATVS